ncbi:adenylate kinase family protein [Candidatus Woesearchaeota archaeon]|nr:adenylate kinase family protein [Candidatus Woesearchaeota archaeon]
MKVIIVSGTPGTGKTRIAKLISKNSSYIYIDVNKLIKTNKIFDSYDKKRKCYIVDTKKLNKLLINFIKKPKFNLILDSHLSHFLPKKYVNLCIITKCNLKVLKSRLNKRKYNNLKIKENLESEIFNVCLSEALQNKHNVIVIDTSKGVKHINIKQLLIFVR